MVNNTCATVTNSNGIQSGRSGPEQSAARADTSFPLTAQSAAIRAR
jgi:hypothetical protein